MQIRDAPKWKFLAEAEQNETLGQRPNTEHGFSHFSPYMLPIFSPLHKLNSQNVLFTVLSSFSKKNLLQKQNNNLKIFT